MSGQTFVVTGANSGLGLETTRLLSVAGASVVMACRDAGRAERAAASVRRTVPAADLRMVALDLGDLSSVTRAAAELSAHPAPIAALINNAGLMATPPGRTANGFETQLGVNHLGHFALTLALLPALMRSSGARVVNVSSTGHRPGRIVLDDLMFERRRYSRWAAYFQSKLANLLFTAELDRRLKAVAIDAVAVAAHPGYATTDLGIGEIPGMGFVRKVIDPLLAQSPEMGAMPTVRAATDPAVTGDEYFGPGGRGEQRGPALRVDRSARAQDKTMAADLWQRSLELTGADDQLLTVSSQRSGEA